MKVDPDLGYHPSMEPCRCGHPSEGEPHPCHGQAYTCRQPARMRFYDARFVALSGCQMKAEVTGTWACDRCWDDFLTMVRVSKQR